MHTWQESKETCSRCGGHLQDVWKINRHGKPESRVDQLCWQCEQDKRASWDSVMDNEIFEQN